MKKNLFAILVAAVLAIIIAPLVVAGHEAENFNPIGNNHTGTLTSALPDNGEKEISFIENATASFLIPSMPHSTERAYSTLASIPNTINYNFIDSAGNMWHGTLALSSAPRRVPFMGSFVYVALFSGHIFLIGWL